MARAMAAISSWWSPRQATDTASAPARRTWAVKLTQQGTGRITSSPGSQIVWKMENSACLAPLVTTMFSAPSPSKSAASRCRSAVTPPAAS